MQMLIMFLLGTCDHLSGRSTLREERCILAGLEFECDMVPHRLMHLSPWSLQLFWEAVGPLERGVLLERMASREVGLMDDCPASLLAQDSCFLIRRDVSKQPPHSRGHGGWTPP